MPPFPKGRRVPKLPVLDRLPHPRWLDAGPNAATIVNKGGVLWVLGTLGAYLVGIPRSERALKELLPSLAATPPELLDLSRSYRANPVKTFLKVRFPMALPFFFSGLKVAVTLAVIGAVVGEFVGSDRGLGYVILSATAYWKSDVAFGAMILLSLMAIVLFALVALAERIICPWYADEQRH